MTARFLKSLELLPKEIELLNEHSKPDDFEFLLELCEHKNIALISDCGTPGFCDPGAELIALCRQNNIPVKTLPGASSLMVFLSGVGLRIPEFHFRGFIPAKTQARELEWKKLQRSKIPFIIMDTPYRLNKVLSECSQYLAKRRLYIGVDLTKENEAFACGSAKELMKKFEGQKREFILLVTV